MIQPFFFIFCWTIPLLAIAGLHMRQIMGYIFFFASLIALSPLMSEGFLVTGFLYGGAINYIYCI